MSLSHAILLILAVVLIALSFVLLLDAAMPERCIRWSVRDPRICVRYTPPIVAVDTHPLLPALLVSAGAALMFSAIWLNYRSEERNDDESSE